MGILADFQIRALCWPGGEAVMADPSVQPLVDPFDPALLNPCSLDVRLGETLMIESVQGPELVQMSIEGTDEENPYLLKPGQFVLAHTVETFHLPDTIAAQFALKSSRAREGLSHALAGYCDAGWHGSVLTLELHNIRQLHAIPLWVGKPIGQMIFHTMDQRPLRDYSKTGRYNGDRSVSGSKG